MNQKSVLSLFCLFLLFLLTPRDVMAQRNGKNVNDLPRFVIESNPPGAYVELSGRYKFVGRTPFIITHALDGKYKLTAKKEGYEGVGGYLDLAARGASRIRIRLPKKTRMKAGVRSLFVPGWGQFYGQSTFKGALVSASQATLGAITIVAALKYDQEKKEFDLAAQRFNDVSQNLEEAERAFVLLNQQFEQAKDAERFRDTMIYVTAGFWVYNFFDAILFFSKDKKPSSYRSIQVGQDRVTLSLKFNL